MPDVVVGIDSPNYTPVSGDLGANIYCKVTATNSVGAASANSNTVGPVAAAPLGYTGPGNIVTGATGFWGLRGYNAAYATGSNPGIDIRNAADTTTTTLNILSDGSLDVASVPGTGGPFRVSKVYDQIGTNHFVQTDHAVRPTLLLNAIGTRPAMVFNLAHGLDGGGLTPAVQPSTVSVFIKLIDTAYQALLYTGDNSIRLDNGQPPGGPANAAMEAGGVGVGKYPLAVNAWYGIQAVFNGAASDFNFNGVPIIGDAGTNGAGSLTYIGHSGAGVQSMNGHIYEFGLWPIAFSGANSSAIYANQAAWWA